MLSIPGHSAYKIWYISDAGSDINRCIHESWPCRTLQAVLDKCPDGAQIYVTSSVLVINSVGCLVTSNKSYSISSANDEHVLVTCSKGIYVRQSLSWV